nr:ATP-binding protein [Streptomyces sp. NBC_01001]
MPRQRGLTEQAADAAIDSACRLLRLPSIRNEFSDIADRAMKDQMTYRGFLAELLMAECDDRARRRSERRIKAAGFPREKSLRSFDFDANPNVASNESFGGWTKTFTDPRLCAAIVDRLTFNGTIIETGTDSYRLASTRARAEEPAMAG